MKEPPISGFGEGETDGTLARLSQLRADLEELAAQIDGRLQAWATVKRVEHRPNVRVDSLCRCGHLKTDHKQYRTCHSGHTYGWGRCSRCRCTKFGCAVTFQTTGMAARLAAK